MPKFFCPKSLTDLTETLTQIQDVAVFISGGTDLVIQLKNGQIKPALLIDLSQVSELNYIKEAEGRLRIGSATTFTQISESCLIGKKARCLKQAASQVGSTQIRNRATLGGNIAMASPAGDSLPALLALGAWVSILGSKGLRRVSFAQLQTEKSVGLQANELITEIDFPLGETPVETRIVSSFAKVGSRSAVTIARLNMAAKVEVDLSNGRIREATWVVGALGPIPFRLEELELSLQGKIINWNLAGEIADRLTEAVDRAIPGRYSHGYKRQAIQGLGYDLLADLFPEQMANSPCEGGRN